MRGLSQSFCNHGNYIDSSLQRDSTVVSHDVNHGLKTRVWMSVLYRKVTPIRVSVQTKTTVILKLKRYDLYPVCWRRRRWTYRRRWSYRLIVNRKDRSVRTILQKKKKPSSVDVQVRTLLQTRVYRLKPSWIYIVYEVFRYIRVLRSSRRRHVMVGALSAFALGSRSSHSYII